MLEEGRVSEGAVANVKVHAYCEHVRGDGRVRMAWLEADTHVVLAIADGNPLKPEPAAAAQMAVEQAMKFAEGNNFPFDAARWVQCITEVDAQVATTGGETTLLILATEGEQLAGAASGDTHARQFGPRGSLPVFARAATKNVVGSKQAMIDPISMAYTSPMVIAASRGLWKYARSEKIQQTAGATPPSKLPLTLANMVRLKTGFLNDDTGIFVMLKRAQAGAPTDEVPQEEITENLPE